MNRMLKGALASVSAVVLCQAVWAQALPGSKPPPSVVVTDLAYTREVAQYFEVATAKSSGGVSANQHGIVATNQSSGTYVAGSYSYVQQRELGSFSNDIKGAILKGGALRLIQGKRFDAGAPQLTKAEQVLNQVQTGKMAAPPARQPEVHDIVARIKKGEFNGADYVLFGTLSSLQFRDSLSPLQGTNSLTHQFTLDLVADFSLISTKTFEIRASFSAQGAGGDTKLISSRGDVMPPNRGKVMRETSQSLAESVYQQLADQVGLELPEAPAQDRNAPPARQAPRSETTILR